MLTELLMIVSILISILLNNNPAIRELKTQDISEVKLQKSKEYGMKEGKRFEDYIISSSMKLKVLNFREDQFVDSIQFVFTDGTDEKMSEMAGGKGGFESSWTIPKDDSISEIIVRHGQFINSLTFMTKKGITSPTFGGKKGENMNSITVPDGYELVGYYGTDCSPTFTCFCKIGFIMAKRENSQRGKTTMSVEVKVLLR